MKKQLSNHAQVAKTIRAHIKSNGIQARVKASSHSCVNVYLEDELPATVKLVRDFCEGFQAGRFDGMQDLYVYDKGRTGPTVNYVFVSNSYSSDVRADAEQYLVDNYAAEENGQIAGMWTDQAVHQVLCGSLGNFWFGRKVRVAA